MRYRVVEYARVEESAHLFASHVDARQERRRLQDQAFAREQDSMFIIREEEGHEWLEEEVEE